MRNKSIGYALIMALMVNVMAIACTIPTSQAQTYNEVNGIINSDITLTANGGPYRFGEVVVASGATLTIEAGTSITDGKLKVDGTLIAKGTSANRIYLNAASITLASTSTGSVIEYANLLWTSVTISGQVTIKNSYLKATQAITTLTITGGSPTISYNTLKGTLDAQTVIRVSGGSPTITNNNIIAHVSNGLFSDPPPGMNRYGSAYGIQVTETGTATITNNNFYSAFGSGTIQDNSGTATIEANNAYPDETFDFPYPTSPPATPTPTPSPTLPPYPPPSTSATPTTAPTEGTINPTSTPTSDDGLYETVIIVIVASVIINASLVVVVAFLLKKRGKT